MNGIKLTPFTYKWMGKMVPFKCKNVLPHTKMAGRDKNDWTNSRTICQQNRIAFSPILDPKTDLPLTSSMQQAALKCEMLWLKKKSLHKFWAIKHCQRTKIGKVLKLKQSLLKNGRIYATIGVKLLSNFCNDVSVAKEHCHHQHW